MNVKSKPSIKTDGDSWVRIGHEVVYKGKNYFVYSEQVDDKEVVINVMKENKGESVVTKVYYQLKDISDITGTQEDYVQFIKYNFVNWLTK